MYLMGFTDILSPTLGNGDPYIRLCKWLKQLDSKLSPVKGFMGSNPLSMEITKLRDHYVL